MSETPIYKPALELVKEAVKILEDEDQRAYYEKVISGTNEAISMLAESSKESHDAKMARLNDAAVRYANQLAYFLFCHEALTDDLAKKLRKLPSIDEVSAEYKKFENIHQEKIDAIREQQEAVLSEQRDMDLFTAVILGNSREEAEAKMAAYAKQVEAAK